MTTARSVLDLQPTKAMTPPITVLTKEEEEQIRKDAKRRYPVSLADYEDDEEDGAAFIDRQHARQNAHITAVTEERIKAKEREQELSDRNMAKFVQNNQLSQELDYATARISELESLLSKARAQLKSEEDRNRMRDLMQDY